MVGNDPPLLRKGSGRRTDSTAGDGATAWRATPHRTPAIATVGTNRYLVCDVPLLLEVFS